MTQSAGVFEKLYRDNQEPWSYSDRGGEMLRHLLTLEKVQSALRSKNDSLAEMGCSLGQFTRYLLPLTNNLTAIDISEVAVAKCDEFCGKLESREGKTRRFITGSATEIPCEDNSVDVILFADGIHGWELTPEEKQKAFSEAHRVLKVGGTAIFTDFLKSEWFEDSLAQVKKSKLNVIHHEAFGDRLWYQFESAFKAVKNVPGIKQWLASVGFARFCRTLAKPFGATGSRHLCVIAKKES